MRIKNLIIILSLFVLVSCSENKLNDIKINGFTMGTTYSITIVDDGKNLHSFDFIKKKIDSVLVEVNNQMSTYQKDSELSLFNESSSTEWHPISTGLISVIKNGRIISSLTDSSYDISAGPLVNLWGFGPESRPVKIPADEEIYERREYVGLGKYEIDENISKIRKLDPRVYIDLSSIAKGFGVDEVGRLLSKIGYKNFMVEIGGEVVTSGKNSKMDTWKIGISTPDASNGIQKIVSLSGNALATSGDYRNYFEENGVRYSHTIDAKTGKPIKHNLASVSVISDNCMMADGVATALDVIGAEKGMKLANEHNWAVFFIIKNKDGFKELMTDEFKKYLMKGNR